MTAIFITWADLSATTGAAAGELASVYGPDAGTHADPVTSATVANIGNYAWSAAPAGWQWTSNLSFTAETYDVVDNATTAQTQLIWTPEQSAINSEGGYDNVDLKLLTSKNYNPDYGDGTFGTDYTFGLGWNLTSAFAPDKPGLPAVSYRIESKFRYNRLGTYVTQSEIHVGALIPQDDHSIEFRPITIGAPHDKADWAESSAITFQTAYISMLDGAASPNQWMTFDARASNGGIRYLTTTNLRRREFANNFPTVQQNNATASGYLNLPYINAANHLRVEQPIDLGANASLNAFGNIAAIGFSGSVPTNGALLSYTDFAVTGNNTLFDVRGAASTYMEQRQENQHASGASGYNVAGKAALYFGFVDTVHSKNFGIRYVASTQELSIGGQLRGVANGVGDFVTFDCTTGQAAFAYPPRIDPVAVASLPGAAAAGAGARAFVGDASATTFASVVAGGGASVVPVYSDGADWRVG